ncbi:MAG: hypothetical protein IJP61_10465 [Treponema sp.]|nr:hypothetical protein [Treponema sp.]
MNGCATILYGNSKTECVFDEIDPSVLNIDELFVKNIAEISLFSDFAQERNIAAYYLYSKQTDSQEKKDNVPKILFINQEKIIFGCKKNDFPFVQNSEYMIELSFPLKIAGPIKTRKIFAAFVVERVFNEEEKSCIICRISRVKQEDIRFLEERA